MGRLQDKVALVLGGSSRGGIGEGIAERFAAEGAKVAVAGRRLEGAQAVADAVGGAAYRCDITREDQIEQMVVDVIRDFGRIDIAVDAAGVRHHSLVAETKESDLLHVAHIHFIGAAMFIKHAAAAMGEGGSIVLISSLNSELSSPRMVAYAATKAAMDKVMTISAVEYACKGIRINSVQPGAIDTPMTEDVFVSDERVAPLLAETPLGRMSSVADVAAAALWLASDECATTGDVVRIAGGMHLRRLPAALPTRDQIDEAYARRRA